jgi:hypothetical protein
MMAVRSRTGRNEVMRHSRNWVGLCELQKTVVLQKYSLQTPRGQASGPVTSFLGRYGSGGVGDRCAGPLMTMTMSAARVNTFAASETANGPSHRALSV